MKYSTHQYRRDTKKYNPLKFQEDLISTHDKKQTQELHANELSKEILDTLVNNLEIHAPYKKLSRKETENKQNPWLTQGILNSIKTKTKLYKKFMRTKSSIYFDEYKTRRNMLNNHIRANKKMFYRDYFQTHLKCSKKTWKGINLLLNRKCKVKDENIFLIEKNKIVSDQKTNNKYIQQIFYKHSRELGYRHGYYNR